MMSEDDEFLSMDVIEKLARESIPANYELLGVHFETPAAAPSALPGSMVIRIEFRNNVPEDLQDTSEDIRAFQGWANPLIAKIRTQWPREGIAISFHEKMKA